MVNKIEQDHQRFRQIVRGRIRKDLRRFISRGELIAREGDRVVSIPVHDIDIPTFRYGDNSSGVGMGDGEEGDAAQGSGNIGAVAPGIAIALIATAAALADAIPAAFSYNIFAARLNRFDGALEGFGSELIALMVREGRI